MVYHVLKKKKKTIISGLLVRVLLAYNAHAPCKYFLFLSFFTTSRVCRSLQDYISSDFPPRDRSLISAVFSSPAPPERSAAFRFVRTYVGLRELTR